MCGGSPREAPLVDLFVGRWLFFLARGAGDDTRDVWCARARVAPDGSVLQIAELHDLTNTPLGDDHELVVRGAYAAFATRAYGQEQGVTLLSFCKVRGCRTRPRSYPIEAMAALTNVQRTGRAAGIGRVQVTLESPGNAVGSAARRPTRSILPYSMETLGTCTHYEAWLGSISRVVSSTRRRIGCARGRFDASSEAVFTLARRHAASRVLDWAGPYCVARRPSACDARCLSPRHLLVGRCFDRRGRQHRARDAPRSTPPARPSRRRIGPRSPSRRSGSRRRPGRANG
jgi:hypothetical protein